MIATSHRHRRRIHPRTHLPCRPSRCSTCQLRKTCCTRPSAGSQSLMWEVSCSVSCPLLLAPPKSSRLSRSCCWCSCFPSGWKSSQVGFRIFPPMYRIESVQKPYSLLKLHLPSWQRRPASSKLRNFYKQVSCKKARSLFVRHHWNEFRWTCAEIEVSRW